MSHSSGEVIDNNKVIGYFEYNGTGDICCPWIYDTYQEMSDNWRRDGWKNCAHITNDDYRTPTNKLKVVTLWTSYGNGYYFKGVICEDCKVIVGGQPFGDHNWWDSYCESWGSMGCNQDHHRRGYPIKEENK